MKVTALSCLNRLSRLCGCQLVSPLAGRHTSQLKHVQENGGELDILGLAVQCERWRLGGRPFTIVQIGANDGRRHDPYRAYIEKYAFAGVLVEPNPPVFRKLLKTYADRPQLKFENVAIADREGQMVLYTLEARGGASDELSVYASLNRDEVARFRSKLGGNLAIQPVTVPVITYPTLLARNSIEQVSLLAIDTEGYDYQILKTVDLSTGGPSIIQFEHGCLTPADEAACQDLLMAHGYTVGRKFGSDTLAVSRACRDAL